MLVKGEVRRVGRGCGREEGEWEESGRRAGTAEEGRERDRGETKRKD